MDPHPNGQSAFPSGGKVAVWRHRSRSGISRAVSCRASARWTRTERIDVLFEQHGKELVARRGRWGA